jgi:hypothetical protein
MEGLLQKEKGTEVLGRQVLSRAENYTLVAHGQLYQSRGDRAGFQKRLVGVCPSFEKHEEERLWEWARDVRAMLICLARKGDTPEKCRSLHSQRYQNE